MLRATPTKRLRRRSPRNQTNRRISGNEDWPFSYINETRDNFSDFVESGSYFAKRKIPLEIQNHLHETSSVIIGEGRR